MRRLTLETTPLRISKDYRRLFFGDTISTIGTQMTAVAAPLQVYEITHSSFAVGLIGLFVVVPLAVFGLIGGAIADATDRRKLLVGTQSGLVVTTALLTLQAALGNTHIGLIYALVAANGALFGLDSPTRRAATPRLIPNEQFAAAATLQQASFNLCVITGPLLAGALVGAFGFRWVYLIDFVSTFPALAAALLLPPIPPEGGGRRPGVASLLEGFRFLRTRRNVLMTFLVDINAMVFGMPRALFPALAATAFTHNDPAAAARVAGILYAAPAVGALLAAVLSGPLSQIRRQGLAVLVSVGLWGLAIAIFGFVHTLWLGCLMLAVAGAADMVSAVFRTAILQAATPDELRGRLSGVFIVVVAGGPRLGDLEAGTAAALVSPQFSVVSGGVACMAGVALLAALQPGFARYDAENPVP